MILTQLAKIFLAFMELRGSLPCSQKPIIGPCIEPFESSLQPHILFLKHVSILSSFLCLNFPNGLFPAMHATHPVNLILGLLVKGTNYEAPHVVCSVLLLLPFSQVQIFPWTLCCQASSICVFPTRV